MRRLLIALLPLAALVAGGCSTKVCKAGSLLVKVTFAAGITADTIKATVVQTDGTTSTANVKLSGSASTGTLELDFKGAAYPKLGFTLDLEALKGGALVGAGHDTLLAGSGTADNGCDSISVNIGAATAMDMTVLPDLMTDDGPDMTVPPDLTEAPDLTESPDLTSSDDPMPSGDPGDMTAVDLIVPCPAYDGTKTTYVDQTNGTDDQTHGGGPGACAWKSILYALKNTSSTVDVAAGNYAPSGSVPYTLVSTQKLACASGGVVSLNGGVVFTGTANAVTNCVVLGGSTQAGVINGACIEVNSAGSHIISGVTLSGCTSAGITNLYAAVGAGPVTVQNSIFQNLSANAGINWTTSGATLTVSGNTFQATVTPPAPYGDIYCGSSGQTNVIPGLAKNTAQSGTLTCANCAKCGTF